MPVDNRSPEQAYTTKDNIVVPIQSEYGATTAHLNERTIAEAANKARLNEEPQPSTKGGTGASVNQTRATKGRG